MTTPARALVLATLLLLLQLASTSATAAAAAATEAQLASTSATAAATEAHLVDLRAQDHTSIAVNNIVQKTWLDPANHRVGSAERYFEFYLKMSNTTENVGVAQEFSIHAQALTLSGLVAGKAKVVAPVGGATTVRLGDQETHVMIQLDALNLVKDARLVYEITIVQGRWPPPTGSFYEPVVFTVEKQFSVAAVRSERPRVTTTFRVCV
jgi:hypothetical protein